MGFVLSIFEVDFVDGRKTFIPVTISEIPVHLREEGEGIVVLEDDHHKSLIFFKVEKGKLFKNLGKVIF